MIYGELLDGPNGKVLKKGVFLNLAEIAVHDKDARILGRCWSGDLETNIALNRYRHNRCMYCGARVGENHNNCIVGRVNHAKD